MAMLPDIVGFLPVSLARAPANRPPLFCCGGDGGMSSYPIASGPWVRDEGGPAAQA